MEGKHRFRYYLISFVILFGCKENSSKKNVVIINKENKEIHIYCDSVNTVSELNSYYLFFKVINNSAEDVAITINNNASANAKTSFIFIDAYKDTLPIYLIETKFVRIVKKKHIAYFTQLIDRSFFYEKYKSSKDIMSFENFVDTLISNSKIIYAPDLSINFNKDLAPNIDTIFLTRNIIEVNMKDIRINKNLPPPRTLLRFIEKKIDSDQ